MEFSNEELNAIMTALSSSIDRGNRYINDPDTSPEMKKAFRQITDVRICAGNKLEQEMIRRMREAKKSCMWYITMKQTHLRCGHEIMKTVNIGTNWNRHTIKHTRMRLGRQIG